MPYEIQRVIRPSRWVYSHFCQWSCGPPRLMTPTIADVRTFRDKFYRKQIGPVHQPYQLRRADVIFWRGRPRPSHNSLGCIRTERGEPCAVRRLRGRPPLVPFALASAALLLERLRPPRRPVDAAKVESRKHARSGLERKQQYRMIAKRWHRRQERC